MQVRLSLPKRLKGKDICFEVPRRKAKNQKETYSDLRQLYFDIIMYILCDISFRDEES